MLFNRIQFAFISLFNEETVDIVPKNFIELENWWALPFSFFTYVSYQKLSLDSPLRRQDEDSFVDLHNATYASKSRLTFKIFSTSFTMKEGPFFYTVSSIWIKTNGEIPDFQSYFLGRPRGPG